MKKRGIIVTLLLFLIVSYGNASFVSEKDEDVVIGAFEESKSKFESLNINYSGKVNNEFLSLVELNYLSNEIMKSMDFKEHNREVVKQEKINQISIYGQVKDEKNMTIILYSYLDEDEKKGETTVFIDINESKDHMNLREITSKISKTLEKQNIKPKITTCIVGSYNGQLRSEYKMGQIEDLISYTNSRHIESLVDNNIMSFSLYTKDIENYIYSGRRKINLNIAIRYNEYDNKTYISIASPIIKTGY